MKSQIRTSLSLFVILSAFLFACGGEKETKALPDAPVTTLIFLDKTQSVNFTKHTLLTNTGKR